MEYRKLGNSDLKISILGFGCGSVGGLMVKGTHKEMLKSVSHALELGINYFDTARAYGDGLSEIHTGALLRETNANNVIVGTKIMLSVDDLHGNGIEKAIRTQIDNSLKRINREYIDIVYTHNRIRSNENEMIHKNHLDRIIPIFEEYITNGKIRYWGLNALGDTAAITEALTRYHPSAIHTCYNLLNPSSSYSLPVTSSHHDYKQIMNLANIRGIGTVGIRILAGGALSGNQNRHPIADQNVTPIATGKTFTDDVNESSKYSFLVKEGLVKNLVEASIRFAITNSKLNTALIGLSSYDQLEKAIRYTNKGPLPDETMLRITNEWKNTKKYKDVV